MQGSFFITNLYSIFDFCINYEKKMPDAALAIPITLYHLICSKYKCYTANVCNKRNSSLYFNIFSDWADPGTIELYKSMRA